MTRHNSDDIMRAIGNLEGTVTGMGANLKSLAETSEIRMNSHSKRIRAVEHKQYWFAGVIAAAALVAQSAWDSLTK